MVAWTRTLLVFLTQLSPTTLTRQGVKVDMRNRNGATARMLAKQYGHMKIVSLIDAHSPSLSKSLFWSPGTCLCVHLPPGLPRETQGPMGAMCSTGVCLAPLSKLTSSVCLCMSLTVPSNFTSLGLNGTTSFPRLTGRKCPFPPRAYVVSVFMFPGHTHTSFSPWV